MGKFVKGAESVVACALFVLWSKVFEASLVSIRKEREVVQSNDMKLKKQLKKKIVEKKKKGIAIQGEKKVAHSRC